MTQSKENYQVSGQSLDEIKRNLNFILQRLADRLDKMEGWRGTPEFNTSPDMKTNKVTNLGTPSENTDAATLGDIPQQDLGPGDSPTFAGITISAGPTSIGGDSADAFGVYGKTPTARPSGFTQTYSTTAKTHSNILSTDVATTGSTTTTPYGYTTSAQADDIPVQINNLIDDVTNVKQVLNALIDDLQLEGLIG